MKLEVAMKEIESLSDRTCVCLQNCCRKDGRNWCVISCGNGPKDRVRESRGATIAEAIINAARIERRHPRKKIDPHFKRDQKRRG